MHAKAGENGLDQGSFAHHHGVPVAGEHAEEYQGHQHGGGNQRHVHEDFDYGEGLLPDGADDVQGVVGGQDPALAHNLQPDAHGGEQDGRQAQQQLDNVVGSRGIDGVEQPHGAVYQIAENEDGQHLHHVDPLEILPEDTSLQHDEQGIEDPGKGANGDVRIVKGKDRGDAGERSDAQVGFDGQAHAQCHHHQSQG